MFPMRRPIRTPPFLTEEQSLLGVEPPSGPPPVPPPPTEAPMPMPVEDPMGPPPPQLRQARPTPPPPEMMPPDPTTTTARPEIPPDPARLRWQDDEDLYRSIQGQRPRMDKPPGLLNRIGGMALGGLGGYLMSSPRAGAQATGQRAMGLIPEILNPGQKRKMQEWSQDLELAKTRADRSKAGLKTEEDLREGESNRQYKEAQGEYYKELPKIRSEQTAATKASKMVMVTPEIAKELGYDDERIGEEISAAQYTADKKQKGFRDHDTAKMAELEKKLKQREDEVAAVTKRLQDIEAGRNQTKKDVAKTAADAKVEAAGKSGARPQAKKLIPRGVKRGDKTYVAYIDANGDTTVTEHEMGSGAAKEDPFLAKLFQGEVKPPEPPKPGAAVPKSAASAVKANSGGEPKPDKEIKIKLKSDGKSYMVKESEFDPKFHERIK